MDLNQRRDELQLAAKHLKKKFVGIDDIIDSIILKITSWYLMPSIQMRPLIINLWGLTGVGKTDLIRELVKVLKFEDRFAEYTFSPSGIVNSESTHSITSSYCSSFREYVENSNLQPNTPNVILLDEFQNFQTIDKFGENLIKQNSTNVDDLWTFLSDGYLRPYLNAGSDLDQMLCDMLYDREREDGDSKSKKKLDKQYRRGVYKALELKHLLNLDDPISAVMRYTDDDIFELTKKAKQDGTIFQPKDFSQTLVFISGNLDTAFKNVGDFFDADRDADEIYEKTKKINVIHIKQALAKKFKPEQISRLGNIHIIYPSIKKEAYQCLITKRLNESFEKIIDKSKLKLQFNVDPSFKELIYNNGVFPAQGVRPLFTTIDDVVNTIMPVAIIEACENQSINYIDLSYRDGRILCADLCKSGKLESIKEIVVPYTGSIDSIKDSLDENQDYKTLVAVHEAGHALLYCLLFKVAPPSMSITQTSLSSSGITNMHLTDQSASNIYNMVKVCYGGTIAQRVLLGESTFGSSQDIQIATDLLGTLIRNEADTHIYEMYNPPVYSSSTSNDQYEVYTDLRDSNTQISMQSMFLYNEAYRIIKENINALKGLSKELYNKKYLKAEEICDILKSYHIKIDVVPASNMLTTPFYDILFDEELND